MLATEQCIACGNYIPVGLNHHSYCMQTDLGKKHAKTKLINKLLRQLQPKESE